MTSTDVDALDSALGGDGGDGGGELAELVRVADHVGRALAAWRLDDEHRRLLHARALELYRPPARARLQALRRRWRMPALVGGGLVTAGAITAITIAIVKGRHQAHQPLPA